MSIDCVNHHCLIREFETLMLSTADIADVRLVADKWTLKEMVAHLIDSASNNHQRFVRLQLEPVLVFPKYDAEEWKDVTKIAAFDYHSLVALWKNYNLLLLHLIENANPKSLGNIWRREDKDITLEFLIQDYFAHMEMHRMLFVERATEIKD